MPNTLHLNLDALDVKSLTFAFFVQAHREVFHQQERERVIERFEVEPEEFTKHISIPHRHVFETDLQTTTKIRPVFNFSLKANDK